MIGMTLSHFQITDKLGEGGMGEVWRATDTKLGREVALKVLSEEFAADPERLERFEREARAVAALNHPHIVTIFSVEEEEDIRFLTMELIDGCSLDKLIPVGGLDLGPFLELATPLAEAMSAAHDKSVIHRDLKPSNVMVDGDRRIKVLDFGLAKLQVGEGVSDSSELLTEALTGVGTVVGTVPYMSPEQIEGKIVDHRTDIFSLGVLLYEMATGERPFKGESSPALMSSILKDVPDPVVNQRTNFPRHLGRVIGRCLEKDPRDRYQTARDVFNELKALRRESSSLSGDASALAGGVSAHNQEYSLESEPSEHLSSAPTGTSGLNRQDEGFWVAVLPFQARAAESAVVALAEGLTEDIVTGLSRFSYLRVISRSSTSKCANEGYDVRAVGEELSARYVMEGSVRQAGPVLRVSVQLVDAESGAHLWAETYNRPFKPEEIFELQDDLAPRIVSTVADMNGVLPHSMSEALRGRDPAQLTPYEALLLSFGYYERLAVEDHAVARGALERAVGEAPDHADCWALLSMLYAEEHKHGFNARPDPLGRALEAARRAVAVSPSNNLAYHMLAQAHFFRRELKAFRNAAERAVALNPMDGCTTAFMGILMAYAGDWDHGCSLAERAMELNPHHPGWYRFSIAINKYRKQDYEGALDDALKINMPSYYFTHAALAAAYGQLGNAEAASTAVRELLAQKPDFAEVAREEWGKWFGPGELLEHMIDGMRKAGLKVDTPGEGQADQTGALTTAGLDDSGTVGIAVLPFADMSPSKDQDYFCEGMAEEIMNALVHVDGIRVASRTSTFKAVEQGDDLRAIGRTLAVGQVLEGSVRMAGSRLRVTAQLTEVESGYQLWSERYDREAEDVFAIQDEIAAGVVEAVTSNLAPGERKVQSRARVHNVEAYRHYLKGRHYRYSKNDHANALAAYQEAVMLDPTHGPSWVGVAEVTVLAAVYSLIPSLEAYAAAKDALATARSLQGESAEGCYVEGMIAFCEARWAGSEAALRRAIELQPTFVQAHGWLGFLLSVQHRFDEAERPYRTARELDPLAAYPYGMTAAGFLTAGRPGEADVACEQALVFDQENSLALWGSGMAKVAMGRFDEGIAALEKAVEHSRRGGFILGLLGWGLATAGRRQEAQAILEELRPHSEPAPTVVPVASAMAALGDVEEAWQILERAEEEKQGILYFASMPLFDPLRSDPRFASLLERLGLPPSPSAQPVDPAVESGDIADTSIAVLPFADHSAEQDQEWFAAGTHEALLTAMQQISALRVTSRTSSMRYRETTLSVPEISGELRVHWLVEGSVVRAGNQIRVSASLINGADDKQVWSGQFERDVQDILGLQNEIAQAVARQIRVVVTPEEKQNLAMTPRVDPDAYRAYVTGLQHFDQVTPEDFRRSVACFEKAVSIDSGFAPAHVAMVISHGIAVEYGWQSRNEADEAVRRSLDAAKRLSQESGEALHALANYQFHMERDLAAAEQSYRSAMEKTSNAYVRFELGWLLSRMGRHGEAVEILEEAVLLDPRSPLIRCDLGWWLYGARDYDRAIEEAHFALELDPSFPESHWLLAAVYAQQDRFEEALAEYQRYESLYGEPVLWFRGYLLALAGRRDEALQVLDQLECQEPSGGELAQIHLGLGDHDRVIEALEAADAAGVWFQPNLWPEYEALHDDPRFVAVLEKFSLPSPQRKRAS